MRLILLAALAAFTASHVVSGMVLAQPQGGSKPAEIRKGIDGAGKPDDKSVFEGRTVVPETKGMKQPQGWTGPINTGSGGAPPESPQGQSPPGMQAAPEGSNKTTVEPAAPGRN